MAVLEEEVRSQLRAELERAAREAAATEAVAARREYEKLHQVVTHGSTRTLALTLSRAPNGPNGPR